MIILRLSDGLGNQLFQYAFGRQLALRHGVPLKLDLRQFNSRSLRSYKLHHYNIAAEIATNGELESFLGKSFLKKVHRKAEKLLPKHKRSLYIEAEWWVHEPYALQAGPNVYVKGFWQHHHYLENLPRQILEELTLKKELAAEAQSMLSSILQAENAVSVHVRRGDYVSKEKANKLMGVLPLDYYQRAVKYMQEIVSNPSFYVFSDDLNWVRQHAKFETPVTFVQLREAESDCAEIHLMSRCRHHIIANSTFSWWGAFLNSSPDKKIIMPAQWAAPSHLNKRVELGFSSWIKM